MIREHASGFDILSLGNVRKGSDTGQFFLIADQHQHRIAVVCIPIYNVVYITIDCFLIVLQGFSPQRIVFCLILYYGASLSQVQVILSTRAMPGFYFPLIFLLARVSQAIFVSKTHAGPLNSIKSLFSHHLKKGDPTGLLNYQLNFILNQCCVASAHTTAASVSHLTAPQSHPPPSQSLCPYTDPCTATWSGLHPRPK